MTMTENKTIDLSILWNRVWSYRRPMGMLVVTATLLATAVAFMLPPWYKATGQLMPPSEEESGFGLARLLRGVAVPGIKVPTQATPADVFIAVLESRRISELIIQRFHLQKKYKKKYMQDAVKELQKHVKFELTDAGTVKMWVEDKNAKTAAEILNTYVTLLDEFNREVRMTKGRRTRLFVEGRLTETHRDLTVAEQKLADYQTKHKTVVLSPEMSSAIESGAKLFAQRTALQVRLGMVQSYSRGMSDEEEQIKQQLVQLDRQLASLPETGLELARLMRDVKVQEQVFVLLTAQFEEARIDEARDIVTVEVLDPGRVPERKDRPRRGLIIASVFLISLGISVAYAMFREEKQPESFTPSIASG